MSDRGRLLKEWLGPNCPDCGVHLDATHRLDCDVARCTACGGQRLQCELVGTCWSHDSKEARWRGEWPWRV
jgi:hypothetical protein